MVARRAAGAVCHKPPFLPPRNAEEEGTNQRTDYRVPKEYLAYLKLEKIPPTLRENEDFEYGV